MEKIVCGWGINDNPVGESRKWVDGKNVRWTCPLTLCWSNAITRCHSQKYKEMNPTYEEATISEDWRYLSNFKAWASDKYHQGLVLDKDILFLGNKRYSPETCVFVPQYVNTSIMKPTPKKSKGYPLGVNERRGRYISQINQDCKKLHLGVFKTAQDAHKAWQKAKIIQLESIINRYSNEVFFNSLVADSLMNRVWVIRLQEAKGEETTFI